MEVGHFASQVGQNYLEMGHYAARDGCKCWSWNIMLQGWDIILHVVDVMLEVGHYASQVGYYAFEVRNCATGCGCEREGHYALEVRHYATSSGTSHFKGGCKYWRQDIMPRWWHILLHVEIHGLETCWYIACAL